MDVVFAADKRAAVPFVFVGVTLRPASKPQSREMNHGSEKNRAQGGGALRCNDIIDDQ